MNLSAFFSSATVSLPRGGFAEGQTTFDVFLEDAFGKYNAYVKQIDDPDHPAICFQIGQSLETLQGLCNQIVVAVKHYLDGYPRRAYDEIEKALEAINIERLFSTLTGSSYGKAFANELENVLECALRPPLYRIRVDRAATATRRLSRKDIFHVPFEKRNLVATQRYSIAGLPCLYLGSSLWICWEELNRPDLDSVWVSRFRFAEEVKVLDFQLPPSLAWHLFGTLRKYSKDPNASGGIAVPNDLLVRFDEKFVASYILCWPLLAACSIKVESREGSFFPQYIVPQILLQWVTQEQRVDGIRYFSTRTRPEEADVTAHYSCVFPARTIGKSGHCSHLRKKFNLTAPISWDLLQTVEINEQYFGASNYTATVTLSDDFRSFYSFTGFFTAECKLGVIETKPNYSKPVDEK